MEKEKQEYLILECINNGKATVRQRDIAKIANISLGTTNLIIKRLVDKGLLKIKHISSKNINYLLTSEGLSIISKRSSDFLKRTIRNVIVFKEAVDLIVEDIKDQNYKTINLVGDSDILFLIENACNQYCIELTVNSVEIDEKETKNIYSESFIPKEASDSIYLATILGNAMKCL